MVVKAIVGAAIGTLALGATTTIVHQTSTGVTWNPHAAQHFTSSAAPHTSSSFIPPRASVSVQSKFQPQHPPVFLAQAEALSSSKRPQESVYKPLREKATSLSASGFKEHPRDQTVKAATTSSQNAKKVPVDEIKPPKVEPRTHKVRDTAPNTIIRNVEERLGKENTRIQHRGFTADKGKGSLGNGNTKVGGSSRRWSRFRQGGKAKTVLNQGENVAVKPRGWLRTLGSIIGSIGLLTLRDNSEQVAAEKAKKAATAEAQTKDKLKKATKAVAKRIGSYLSTTHGKVIAGGGILGATGAGIYGLQLLQNSNEDQYLANDWEAFKTKAVKEQTM